MKNRKRIQLFLSLIVLPIIIGCESERDFMNWIAKTDGYRIEALKQSEVVPYRREQFVALKSYFKEINLLAISLKDDDRRTKKLNKVLKKKNLDEICAQILMDINDWRLITKRCSKNNFFLCSEEVRSYPEAILVIKKLLSQDLQKRFYQFGSCRRSLGV